MTSKVCLGGTAIIIRSTSLKDSFKSPSSKDSTTSSITHFFIAYSAMDLP